MADIAYKRLRRVLFRMAESGKEQWTTEDIGSAFLDAWSIIDSVNRLKNLLAHGIPNEAWKRIFENKTASVEVPRNGIQHIGTEIEELVKKSGQVWGYLSWAAELPSGTGYFVMVPGRLFKGNRFGLINEKDKRRPWHPPIGLIKLNAYDTHVYLDAIHSDVYKLVDELEKAIADRTIRPRGDGASDSSRCDVVFRVIEMKETRQVEDNDRATATNEKPRPPGKPRIVSVDWEE